MKRLLFLGAAAGLSCLAIAVRSQESKSREGPIRVLAMQEGEWDADISTSVPGPNGKVETQKSKGVESNRMLGGKWLLSDFKGDLFGMKFEGHGQNGFDTKKGKYIGTWVDSMTKNMTMLEGSYDEKTKTLVLYADTENPEDDKPMKMRLETQFKEDGSRVMRQYFQMEGQKDFVQMMEFKYTKRKT
jgi:hypothetical protein